MDHNSKPGLVVNRQDHRSSYLNSFSVQKVDEILPKNIRDNNAPRCETHLWRRTRMVSVDVTGIVRRALFCRRCGLEVYKPE